MATIVSLSKQIVSRLRSGTIISEFAQAVEELVCNSIDAKASHISVTVDVKAAYFQVEDNGHGISRENLKLLGNRHATSKIRSLDDLELGPSTLGFRGEALSSLSDVALVEVTSRARGSALTYCKILKGGQTLSLGMSTENRSTGTSVKVRDIFFNQPVRRRLLNASLPKELLNVKEHMIRLNLMHPEISFTLVDKNRQRNILQTSSSPSVLLPLKVIFGENLANSLQEVDFCKGRFRLSGFFSCPRQGQASKAIQYFYLNRRYVVKTPVHKLINKHFMSCCSPKSSYLGPDGHIVSHVGGREQKETVSAVGALKHLYPAFIANLSCPLAHYDITFEASKTHAEFKDWDPVLAFVREVVSELWSEPSPKLLEGRQEEVPPEDIQSPSRGKGRKVWQREDPTYKPRNVMVVTKNDEGRTGVNFGEFSAEIPARHQLRKTTGRVRKLSSVASLKETTVENNLRLPEEICYKTEQNDPTTPKKRRRTVSISRRPEEINFSMRKLFGKEFECSNDVASPSFGSFDGKWVTKFDWNNNYSDGKNHEQKQCKIEGVADFIDREHQHIDNYLHDCGPDRRHVNTHLGEDLSSQFTSSALVSEHIDNCFSSCFMDTLKTWKMSSSPPETHTPNKQVGKATRSIANDGFDHDNWIQGDILQNSDARSVEEYSDFLLFNKPLVDSPKKRVLLDSPKPSTEEVFVRHSPPVRRISLSDDETSNEGYLRTRCPTGEPSRSEGRMSPGLCERLGTRQLSFEDYPYWQNGARAKTSDIFNEPFLPMSLSSALGRGDRDSWHSFSGDSSHGLCENFRRRSSKTEEVEKLSYSWNFEGQRTGNLGMSESNLQYDQNLLLHQSLNLSIDSHSTVSDWSEQKDVGCILPTISRKILSPIHAGDVNSPNSNGFSSQSERHTEANPHDKFFHGTCELVCPQDSKDRNCVAFLGSPKRICSRKKSRRLQRSMSGPPFYEPKGKRGIHGNPISSVATRGPRIWAGVEDLDATATVVQRGLFGATTDKAVQLEPTSSAHVLHREGVPHLEEKEFRCKSPRASVTSELENCNKSMPKSLEKSSRDSWKLNKLRGVERKSVDNIDFKVVEDQDHLCGTEKSTISVDILPLEKEEDGHQCSLSKWRQEEPRKSFHLRNDGSEVQAGGETVAEMYKLWQNPCFRSEETGILDLSSLQSGPMIGSGNIVPDFITSAKFQEARVLQQVDNKFIAVTAEDTLVLVDQHAADERVRLEELRAQMFDPSYRHKPVLLDRPVELALTVAEEQALVMYRERIESWGWRSKMVPISTHQLRLLGATSAPNKVLLSAVPCLLGANLTAKDLVEYLCQLTETDGASSAPAAVNRLLNSKACRGAIMFGDSLQKWECRQVIDHLKLTQLCFQCAHGRPTMVPLTNLQALRKILCSWLPTTGCGSSMLQSQSGKRFGSQAFGENHRREAFCSQSSKVVKGVQDYPPLLKRSPITVNRCQERLASALDML